MAGEVEADLVAGVGEVVDRRHGEVATLVARLVATVATLLGAAGVPGRPGVAPSGPRPEALVELSRRG